MKTKALHGLAFARGLLPQRADFTLMRRSPGRDLLAGLTVAIVALPLALAFGVASGLGATAGLTTAVIAGILAAVFGGSNIQVSGPTGAMTVVLVPVVHQFGVSGVLEVTLMAGVILLVLALSGIGRYVRYLPASLVEGFTAGIAVVIALQQVPNMLGVEPGDEEKVWALAWDAVVRFLQAPDPVAPLITLGVAGVILAGARWRPSLPLSLLAVVIVTVIAAYGRSDLPVIGALPSALTAPAADFFDPAMLAVLLPSALAIAALAALESLLSATVADGMSVGERHNPDRELFGQGIANLVVPFFGGVPATAAIARTAVNVRSGARSRLAAISHSVVLLVVVLVAGSLVGYVPLAALAGVLLATTIQMVQLGAIRAIMRATRGDAVVLVVTFGVTVAIDLVTAVVVGLAAAALLALREVARSARVERVPLDTADHSAEERELLAEHIVAYRFDGPLFFGAAHRFLLELTEVSAVSVVILRMSRVTTLDATGGLMLDDVITRLEAKGIVVLVSGVTDEHRAVLRRLGVAPHLRELGRVFAGTPDAIRYARTLIPPARKPRTAG
ncbi:SulP family inorganic anion transporter [Cryobacterium sp. Sr8]|uniref:SulP family inorganic anion transporter n=1 Tax=Cryobacterium sp. Sr8 TaxID=1259203 RepID=UPI0010695203|nr:SulP family inorganic anion transporter [Cryobacterium sp. Sr8]TFD82100.1 SulP family inorganic anion transporter [Cryobacterium sp. Sr8]